MQDKEYAGFWVRAGATLIDAIFFVIVILIPLIFIYGEAYLYSDKLIYGFWDFLLQYVLPFVATIYFWQRFLGTPGKMATKLTIVDAETGEKMDTTQAVLRYFAYIVSALPLGLGFIWIGVDKRKQGWHDKLAGTVVLKSNQTQAVEFNG